MPTILFVCTANICRSPIAEGIFRRLVKDKGLAAGWRTASAGTWAESGHTVPRHSLNLMTEMGINLRGHRSQIVTKKMIEAADLVLTMESGHKEALQVEFNQSAGKIYLLSEMTDQKSDVPDPFGGEVVDYQETIREIYTYLHRGFDKIIALTQENLPPNSESGK